MIRCGFVQMQEDVEKVSKNPGAAPPLEAAAGLMATPKAVMSATVFASNRSENHTLGRLAENTGSSPPPPFLIVSNFATPGSNTPSNWRSIERKIRRNHRSSPTATFLENSTTYSSTFESLLILPSMPRSERIRHIDDPAIHPGGAARVKMSGT